MREILKTLFFISAIIMASCSQKPTEVMSITYHAGVGDHRYHTLIGLDTLQMHNAVYQSKDMFMIYLDLTDCIVGEKALNHVSQYVLNHCEPFSPEQGKFADLFVIHVFLKNDKQVCSLHGKDQARCYFIGLRTWIEESPYKEECKCILACIEPYCR